MFLAVRHTCVSEESISSLGLVKTGQYSEKKVSKLFFHSHKNRKGNKLLQDDLKLIYNIDKYDILFGLQPTHF